MKKALVLCARRDPRFNDRVAQEALTQALTRNCAGCGEELYVAPNTARQETVLDLEYRCNPCGNASVAARGTRQLGILPGALPATTPDNRRRRSELEAHGFRDIDPENL